MWPKEEENANLGPKSRSDQTSNWIFEISNRKHSCLILFSIYFHLKYRRCWMVPAFFWGRGKDFFSQNKLDLSTWKSTLALRWSNFAVRKWANFVATPCILRICQRHQLNFDKVFWNGRQERGKWFSFTPCSTLPSMYVVCLLFELEYSHDSNIVMSTEVENWKWVHVRRLWTVLFSDFMGYFFSFTLLIFNSNKFRKKNHHFLTLFKNKNAFHSNF